MQKTILCLLVVAFADASRIHSSRIATKRALAQVQKTSFAKSTGDLSGVEALKNDIDKLAGGSDAKEDAKEFLDTLFGGLFDAKLLEKSEYEPLEDSGVKALKVTLLGDDVVGELATKSKVPYEAQVGQTMFATAYATESGAIEISMTGLCFAPPSDTQGLFEEVLAYQETAAGNSKQCKKECKGLSANSTIGDRITCESCVAYEWYKTHANQVASRSGKMARILTNTPFGTKALSLEKQQGNWTPSLVGDKNRRRIIYSMLAAAPACFEKFIFGTTPTDFGAPAEIINAKKKSEKTYADGRYMAVVTRFDFEKVRNVDKSFFMENHLQEKSLEIGKASLIGKQGTTYDYPLDMAEAMGQGTSGINFARLVSAANPILHEQQIFVRPAKPDKVMKMLGLCKEALVDASKIDSGCGGNEGRIWWKRA